MKTITTQIDKIFAWVRSQRGKKIIYLVVLGFIVFWVVGRFGVIAAQNRLEIYNPARAAATHGVPVDVVRVVRRDGIIREPITVKNNRVFVSGPRAALLAPGQRVGDGEIVSVARGIDLDTGMHTVRTRGVADGLQFAEFHANGYFIPVHIIENGHIMVATGDRATRRAVTVTRQDSSTAYVTDGLNDGDIIILSRVQDGEKIQIKE